MAKKTAFDKQREAKQKAKQSTSTGRGRSTSKKTTKVRSSSAISAQKKAGSGAKGQEVRQAPKFQVKETVGREVRSLICLLVWGLLASSICLGPTFGVFGETVRDVSVGVFGIGAYLLCFAGILVVLLRMWRRPEYPSYAKDLCIVLLILAIMILMHIINETSIEETLEAWYFQAKWYTGGVVGAVLGNLLLQFFGKVGAILLLVGIMVICLVVITEKSAIQAAIKAWAKTRKVTKNVEENVREKVKQHQEQRRTWEQEENRTEEQEKEPEIHIIERTSFFEETDEGEKIPSWMTPQRKEEPEADRENVFAYVAQRQKVQDRQVVETEGGEPDQLAVQKAAPVTKEEQAQVNYGIQQNLFADASETAEYVFPTIDLLEKGEAPAAGSRNELYQNAQKLENALMSFGVEARVTQVNQGPTVTRYELIPRQGVKVSRIVNLAGDIALNLAAPSIRIEAPIPGKSAVGIEVPNRHPVTVTLREIIESDVFRKFPSKLAFSLGKTIDGEVKVADIAKMPHLLIAGATGSGKSVCINSLLISILYKAHPKDVKLILIDPKVVELSVYNGIPHLLLPVVNDPKKAAAALNWAVQEMSMRYKKFADLSVRDIKGYNEAVQEHLAQGEVLESMPQIVIVIDELADLMMVAGKEVEEAICRLAQMARAAGMHLVIATQRPSVDVITGVIKANIPSRLAFAVSSGVDSKTILDTVGAEKLLGKGDMLFCPIGASKAVRIQGAFVSDHEVERVVEAVRQGTSGPSYQPDLTEKVENAGAGSLFAQEEEKDEYLEDAIRMVVEKQKASISMLQRAYRIGFNRAARLIEAMYERGIVGPDEGSKPRKVLMTKEEYEEQGVSRDEQLQE